MFLGRVVGRVVCTVKAKGLEGVKLLLVQPINEDGSEAGSRIVAADVAQSGLGDPVFVVQGRESSMALKEMFVPTDATIVGHVEEIQSVNTKERRAAKKPRRQGKES